jgi:CubicO group peptidase (beta-lactamase class C family)
MRHATLLSFVALGLVACKQDPEPTPPTQDSATPDPFAVVDPSDVVKRKVERELQTFFEVNLARQGATGGQLAVVWRGELVLLLLTGVRSPDDDTPVGRDTRFQLGSTTKMLTATTVLQQVEAGQFAVGDRAADVLDGFTLQRSPEWDGTVHDLLTHQAALYDLWDARPAPDDGALADGVGEFSRHGWASAPAGALYRYSNTHYSLLGRAVELASGEGWADVLERDVLAPLGMDRTVARTAEALADPDHCVDGTGWTFADGFDPWDPFQTWDYALSPPAGPVDPVDNAFTRPAALVWGTAVDEARFGQFLIRGDQDVLSDELRAQMTTAHVAPDVTFPTAGYGYGLDVFEEVAVPGGYLETPAVAHTGNTITHASILVAMPDQELVVAAVATGTFTSLYPAAAEVIGTLLSDLPRGNGQVPTGTPAPLDALVGTYEDPGAGPITIGRDGDVLTIDIPEMVAAGYGLEPTLRHTGAGNDYVASATSPQQGPFDLVFTFVPDDGGEFRWLNSRFLGGERTDRGR